MNNDNLEWEQEYNDLLASCQNTGEIETVSDDKRNFPRFRINTGSIWVRTDSAFDVANISVSGISFYSDRRFDSGEIMAITLGKAFRIEAQVVACEMVESDARFLETRYLTRCTFTEEHSSMRFLVMMKEMDEEDGGPVSC